jgi:uncharacterized membrane protein (UPF0182 family)
MRMPTPPAAERPRARRRFAPRVALVVAVVVLIVLLASARQLAVFYTDKLWFDDLGFGGTWRTLLVAHIVPALIFTAAMFVLLLASLIVADRLAPRFRNMGPEDEIVERYRTFVAPYAGRVRVLVALVFAILVGVGASSQWKQWILFRNRVTWGVKDAEFHKDIGFYVFTLPFLRFIFSWLFVVLLVVLLITAVFHYLNGGIRFQAPYQHVTPQVKAHLSVILALMAITKTAQYWYGRYELVFSHRGAVDGATYTDVRAQLPALEFLALISVVAAILFVVNIWQRGWALPAIAVGLWAFISIVLGTAYPAYVQNFQVKPNELAREQKYIGRNIQATRAAFGLDKISTSSFSDERVTQAAVNTDAGSSTLGNVRLWDSDTVGQAFKAKQEFAGFYKFSTANTDRYTVGDNQGQQVWIAARNIDLSGLPNDTWTNRHLVYTHGYAAVAAAADGTDSKGNPSYVLSNIPPEGDLPRPAKTQYDVYFGDGVGDYSIGNSKQSEIQLANGNGDRKTVHYQGTRGVEMSSFLRRAAFAIRFSDFNLLVSSQITDQSRMLYVRDVTARAQKAAPFLRFDTSPYLVMLGNGDLEWVLDAYTVTNRYPYSQEIRGNDVDDANGLGSDFNYARNSVKATVNAYDGTVKFYVVDPTDPLVRSYRKAFPDLFTDASKMPRDLPQHLRYPQQLFKVQARQYELYHIKNPDDFYNGVDQWAVSPAPSDSAGTATGETPTPDTTPVSGSNGGRNARLRPPATGRFQPVYQTLSPPGSSAQEFVLSVPYVPVSRGDVRDNQLTSFLTVRNDGYSPSKPGDYGKFTLYDVTNDNAVSPVQAARLIEQDKNISSTFTLLRQGGSTVVLGDVQLVPVGDGLLYVRPVYVKASSDPNAFPTLTYLAMSDGSTEVLGCAQPGTTTNAAQQQSSVAANVSCAGTTGDPVADALAKFFGTTPPPANPGGNNTGGNNVTVPPTFAATLQKIQQDIQTYRSATASGDFAKAGQALADAQRLLNTLLTQANKTTTTTTAPKTGASTTTTAPPVTTTTAST